MKTKNPSTPKSLLHLMLNSGESTRSRRSAFCDHVLDGLSPFVTQEGMPPFRIPWDVSLAINTTHKFAVFSLTKNRRRLVTCVLSFGSENEIPWRVAMDSYEADTEAREAFGDAHPPKPRSGLWLTVQLHRAITRIPDEEVLMLEYFQVWLAWTIVREYRKP